MDDNNDKTFDSLVNYHCLDDDFDAAAALDDLLYPVLADFHGDCFATTAAAVCECGVESVGFENLSGHSPHNCLTAFAVSYFSLHLTLPLSFLLARDYDDHFADVDCVVFDDDDDVDSCRFPFVHDHISSC